MLTFPNVLTHCTYFQIAVFDSDCLFERTHLRLWFLHLIFFDESNKQITINVRPRYRMKKKIIKNYITVITKQSAAIVYRTTKKKKKTIRNYYSRSVFFFKRKNKSITRKIYIISLLDKGDVAEKNNPSRN